MIKNSISVDELTMRLLLLREEAKVKPDEFDAARVAEEVINIIPYVQEWQPLNLSKHDGWHSIH